MRPKVAQRVWGITITRYRCMTVVLYVRAYDTYNAEKNVCDVSLFPVVIIDVKVTIPYNTFLVYLLCELYKLLQGI